MQENIVSRILGHAATNPVAPAFIYQNKIITYKQFNLYVCSAARILHQRGIRPGDTVVLMMHQSPVYCIAMLALAAIGAVGVPLNPASSAHAKDSIRKRYDLKAVVSDIDGAGIEQVQLLKLVDLTVDGHGADMGFTSHQPTPETPFCIAMSSGTTGDPKGIVYTHRYLLGLIDTVDLELSNDSRHIPLVMHIAFGFLLALAVLRHGGTLVFPKGNKGSDRLAAINLFGVTHLAFPPSSMMNFLPFISEGENPFPSVRLIRVGGSGLTTKLVKTLLDRFPKVIQVAYGLTELGVVAAARADILAAAPMSCGKVDPSLKLEVVDSEDRTLPNGTTGEIRIRLEGMPNEYFKDERNSRLRFKNGWYYTGDMGSISAEGLLFIEGRVDDIISLGGHKISPGHVEEILTRHPRVSDAVVFLSTADNGEEILAAAVIMTEGEAEPELLEYGKANLVGRAAPQKFYSMRSFPRNSSGKVLRKQIVAAALASGSA